MVNSQKEETQEIPTPSSEELKEEEEALEEAEDEEIRSQIVKKYDLDEDSQSETIDKLVEDLKEQRKVLGKAIKQKRDWRTKATSLAEKPKGEKPEQPPKEDKPSDTLSQTDLLTLMKADVAEEDIQEVIDYANLKKISVKEALNSGVIKSLLAEKEEERKTADVAATKQKRTGQTVPLGSELLKQAETKGELPEDEEGMEKLVESRFSKKAANK